MDALQPFRKHRRLSICILALIYVCFIVRVVKDPRALVLLIGAGVLMLIFFYPSKSGTKPKRRKYRAPPPRKKTKKRLDWE
jgi:hypothetical protein